jgi:hypothetical protein
MHRHILAGTVLLTVLVAGSTFGGEPSCCEPRPGSHVASIAPAHAATGCIRGFLRKIAPVEGWNPYGDLLHWRPTNCFPCAGGPDDYCRKSLPCVCWPRYPSYFVWAPPEACSTQYNCQPGK